MKLLRCILVVLYFVSPSLSYASDKLYIVDNGVSVLNEDSPAFEEALKSALAVAAGPRDKKMTILKKDLRDKVLKTLKIADGDLLFFKALDNVKSYTYKVSELQVGIEQNVFEAGTISDVVLILPAEENFGVASIGKVNPFNDTRALISLKSEKGAYQITPDIKLLEKSGKADNGFRTGRWEYAIQIGKEKSSSLKSYDLYTDHYVSDVQILGGDIFADGSAFIHVTGYHGCGFFVRIKDKKAEVTEPSCGYYSC